MSERPSVEKTLKAVYRELAASEDNEYGFDGAFETKRGKYDIHVDFELMGASIFEDKVELLVKISDARHMPKKQDDDLIEQIEQTMIDVIHGGSSRIDPEVLSVKPHIMKGAIKYMDGNDLLDKMEEDILEMCMDQELSLEEVGELLNRLLDKVVGTMEAKSDAELEALERLVEARVGRQFGVSEDGRMDYIN